MHQTPAPGVTLLTEITRHRCRGKVVFPSLCVPALQPEVMAAWPGTSLPEPSLVQSSLRTKAQNPVKQGGDHSGSCPELRSKLSPLHSYPRKSTTEQAQVPLHSDLQLQLRRSQRGSKAVGRRAELHLWSTEATSLL